MWPQKLRRRLQEASKKNAGWNEYLGIFTESKKYTENNEKLIQEMISRLENRLRLQAKRIGECQTLEHDIQNNQPNVRLQKGASKLAGELYRESISAQICVVYSKNK